MDNLLNDFLARLKATPFAQPGAERGFMILRRGKGLRQIFNFQLVNGTVNELAFTNTREPAMDIQSDTLDEAFVLQACGDRKLVTGQAINYFDVVALRDILLSLIPMNIVVSFSHIDYNRFGFNGYMVHEGVYIRVEMTYHLPRVGHTESKLSKMLIEQALLHEQDLGGKGDPRLVVENGARAGRVLRDVALARAAQISQGVHPADLLGEPDDGANVAARGTATGKSLPTDQLVQRVGVIGVTPREPDPEYIEQVEAFVASGEDAPVAEAPPRLLATKAWDGTEDEKGGIPHGELAAISASNQHLLQTETPEVIQQAIQGLSGCAMAPTLGLGLNSEVQAELQATGLAEAAKLDHPTA